MNKIVRKHYPVERLPADLQTGLPKHGRVHIEIEPELEGSEVHPIANLVASGRNVHGSPKTILAHIQGLREDR